MLARATTQDSTAGRQERGASETAIIHVVDDEPSIQTLFQELGQIEHQEVRTYNCGRDFLAVLDERQPGCLVLDLNLPDLSGLQVLEELARRGSTIPVVFMSGLAKVSEAVLALRLGSLDFVEKPFEVAAMVAAIRRALDHDHKRRLDARSQETLRARFAELTAREQEVMELVVQGLPNKSVAAKLGVSPKTVEVHRANVMRKTAAGSLAELVRMVVAKAAPIEAAR